MRVALSPRMAPITAVLLRETGMLTREMVIDGCVHAVIANNRIKSWFALNEFRLYFRNGTEWSPTGTLFIEQVKAEWGRMVA